MTYILKCDTCGKTQEHKDSTNPINPDTNKLWYSRRDYDTGIWYHACCVEHCDKEKAMIWPEWAR